MSDLNPLLGPKMFLNGIPVIVNPYLPPDQPKVQLSPGDYVSDEFRAEMNQWLDKFFGRVSVYYMIDKAIMSRFNQAYDDLTVYGSCAFTVSAEPGKSIAVNPITLADLKRAAKLLENI